jgi:hypothetical protein
MWKQYENQKGVIVAEQNRTEQNRLNIVCYYMSIPGWHRIARVVLNPKGICTTITAQSNNLLQKVLVKVD